MANFYEGLNIGYVELEFDNIKQLSFIPNLPEKSIIHTKGVKLSEAVSCLNSIIENIGDGYLVDNDNGFFIKGFSGSMVRRPHDNTTEYVWSTIVENVGD